MTDASVEHGKLRKIPPGPLRTTSVYRYYDRDGVLLYVGITNRGQERNREHFKSKDWWRFVARQDVSHYASRGEAEEHEKNLIQRYQPPFNVTHNPFWEDLRAEYLDLAEVPTGEEQRAWSAGWDDAASLMLSAYLHAEMLSQVIDRIPPRDPFIGGGGDADSIHPS